MRSRSSDVDALEVERALGRLDAVGGIGEVDQAVGPADDVVGTVQPAAGPGLGERVDVAAVAGHPREPPAVLLAEDDRRPGSQVWPLAALGLIPQQLASVPSAEMRNVRSALMSWNRSEPSERPERAFGELKPLVQELELCLADQIGKPAIAQDLDHDARPASGDSRAEGVTIQGSRLRNMRQSPHRIPPDWLGGCPDASARGVTLTDGFRSDAVTRQSRTSPRLAFRRSAPDV